MGMAADESWVLHLPSLDNTNLETIRSKGNM